MDRALTMAGGDQASPSVGARVQAALPPLAIAAGVLLLCNLPRLFVYLHTPPGRIFMGAIWGSYDAEVYFQTIGDGAAGAWLWLDRADGGPHSSYLIYPPFLLAGHLMAPLRLSPELVYEACRWIAEPLALAASWLYIRASLPAGARLIGYVLALLGGGLGWLVIGRIDTPIGTASPIDLSDPVFNVLNSFQMAPHLALSVAGLAIYGWGLLQAAEGRWRGLWGAPALAMVTSYHEFVSPAALVFGACFVLWRARTRTGFLTLALCAALSAPFDLYLLWLKLFDPLASHWTTGGTWEIENLPSLLVGRAILLPFVALGVIRAVRSGARGPALALCWVLVSIFFNAGPIFRDSALHRSLEGSSLAWGVLAAYGLFELGARWRLYVISGALISALLQAPLTAMAGAADPGLFWNRSEYLSMSWLRQSNAAGRVLASPYTARRVLAMTHLRNDRDGSLGENWIPDQLIAVAPGNRSDWMRARGDTVLFWGEAEQTRYGQSPPAGLQVLHREGRIYVLGPG